MDLYAKRQLFYAKLNQTDTIESNSAALTTHKYKDIIDMLEKLAEAIEKKENRGYKILQCYKLVTSEVNGVVIKTLHCCKTNKPFVRLEETSV